VTTVSLPKPPCGGFRGRSETATWIQKWLKMKNVNIDTVEVVSSELINVMISKGKEGGRAISVPWRY
jgi:hypothetical protein